MGHWFFSPSKTRFHEAAWLTWNSLCSLDWLQVCGNHRASVSWVLELQMWVTMPIMTWTFSWSAMLRHNWANENSYWDAHSLGINGDKLKRCVCSKTPRWTLLFWRGRSDAHSRKFKSSPKPAHNLFFSLISLKTKPSIPLSSKESTRKNTYLTVPLLKFGRSRAWPLVRMQR